MGSHVVLIAKVCAGLQITKLRTSFTDFVSRHIARQLPAEAKLPWSVLHASLRRIFSTHTGILQHVPEEPMLQHTEGFVPYLSILVYVVHQTRTFLGRRKGILALSDTSTPIYNFKIFINCTFKFTLNRRFL